MISLFLKIVLVPLLIGGITWAGEKLGPRIAGALTGLPVVAGPLALFVTLEQGPAFAAASAAATLAGVASVGAFCIVYARVALRRPWWVAVLAGWAAFGAATALLDALRPSLAEALGLALATPVAIVLATPRPTMPTRVAAVSRAELGVRMATGVVLVVLLTAAAHALGPRLSGLLTIFPVATTILAVFSHRAQGAAFAIHLLRGLAFGLYSLAAFFLVIATAVARLGVASFVVAVAAAIGVQLVVLWGLAWRARRVAA